jgi:hypothetical protein
MEEGRRLALQTLLRFVRFSKPPRHAWPVYLPKLPAVVVATTLYRVWDCFLFSWDTRAKLVLPAVVATALNRV